MGRKRSRKNAVMGLLAVSGSLVVAVVLLEAGLWTWHYFSTRTRDPAPTRSGPMTWIAPADDIGYRLHPDHKGFSATGSQNQVAGKPSEKFRLLILGDSVAFSGRFERSIPGYVERSLTAVAPIEVLNSSVPGYTNYQEIVWLKEYGLQFKPSLVGVIFVLNDLHRILHFVEIRPGEPIGNASLPFAPEAAHPPSSLLYRGLQQSHLVRSVRQRLPILSAAITRWLEGGYTFEYRGDFFPAWKQEYWPPIEDQLRELTALGREHDFRVFLVAVPFGDQYLEGYLELDEEFVKMPQRNLSEICGRLDIPYLDLYDFLGSDSFRDDRVHLRPEARVVAGERIARFLLEERLTPSTPQTVPLGRRR